MLQILLLCNIPIFTYLKAKKRQKNGALLENRFIFCFCQVETRFGQYFKPDLIYLDLLFVTKYSTCFFINCQPLFNTFQNPVT